MTGFIMKSLTLLVFLCTVSFCSFAQDITIYKSSHNYEVTVARLDSILDNKAVTRYQTVVNDFETDTSKYQNQVFLFEDKVLTNKVMSCEPSATLDLPLKIVVWAEEEDVYLGYIDPSFMKKRFRIQDCDEQLGNMTRMIVRIINECIRKV